jgi:hypothetical protein
VYRSHRKTGIKDGPAHEHGIVLPFHLFPYVFTRLMSVIV